jgi:hypothetical protein
VKFPNTADKLRPCPEGFLTYIKFLNIASKLRPCFSVVPDAYEVPKYRKQALAMFSGFPKIKEIAKIQQASSGHVLRGSS